MVGTKWQRLSSSKGYILLFHTTEVNLAVETMQKKHTSLLGFFSAAVSLAFKAGSITGWTLMPCGDGLVSASSWSFDFMRPFAPNFSEALSGTFAGTIASSLSFCSTFCARFYRFGARHSAEAQLQTLRRAFGVALKMHGMVTELYWPLVRLRPFTKTYATTAHHELRSNSCGLLSVDGSNCDLKNGQMALSQPFLPNTWQRFSNAMTLTSSSATNLSRSSSHSLFGVFFCNSSNSANLASLWKQIRRKRVRQTPKTLWPPTTSQDTNRARTIRTCLFSMLAWRANTSRRCPESILRTCFSKSSFLSFVKLHKGMLSI